MTMTNDHPFTDTGKSVAMALSLSVSGFFNKITDLLASNDNDNDDGYHHLQIAPDNGKASSHDPLAKKRGGLNLIAFNGRRVYDAIDTFTPRSSFIDKNKLIIPLRSSWKAWGGTEIQSWLGRVDASSSWEKHPKEAQAIFKILQIISVRRLSTLWK